jgi:glycosyltransferase involved in cell wall biosynthesis
MNDYKVVYIDRNFIDDRYPNKPSDGDSFYTHGFSSLYAREFKKYNPEITVECWKADPCINKAIEKEIQGVYYRMFPSWNLGKIGQYSPKMIRFLNKLVKINFSTVFNISSFDHLLFYSLALNLKNYPLVVQHHGEATAIYKLTIKKGLKKVYFSLLTHLEKRCFRNIDLLYVLDDRIKKWLPDNKNQLDIKVSTTGVDENVFIPLDKTEAKKIIGLDPKKKYLLYVGRLNHTKRPDLLIDVYNALKKERNDVGLILAGHETTDPLYPIARESGAILYGVIQQGELYKYLSAATVYVLAQLDRSIPFGGIGMLSVQALLCQTPIIGGTVEVFPEIDREKIGIATFEYIQLKEGILKIINGEFKNNNFREYAQKYYSWEMISKASAKDYVTLINKMSSKSILI